MSAGMLFSHELLLRCDHINITFSIVPSRNTMTPPQLTRNTPVPNVVHPRHIHVGVLFWHENLIRPSCTASMQAAPTVCNFHTIGQSIMVQQSRLNGHREVVFLASYGSILSSQPSASCSTSFTCFKTLPKPM